MTEMFHDLPGFPRYVISRTGKIKKRMTWPYVKPLERYDGVVFELERYDGLMTFNCLGDLMRRAFFDVNQEEATQFTHGTHPALQPGYIHEGPKKQKVKAKDLLPGDIIKVVGKKYMVEQEGCELAPGMVGLRLISKDNSCFFVNLLSLPENQKVKIYNER